MFTIAIEREIRFKGATYVPYYYLVAKDANNHKDSRHIIDFSLRLELIQLLFSSVCNNINSSWFVPAAMKLDPISGCKEITYKPVQELVVGVK